MGIVDRTSLAETLDALNEVFFYGKALPKTERLAAAKWLASRRGLPRSYAGMFAPTDKDFTEGARVFTGEKIASGGATGHILGEEAMRALLLLGVKTRTVLQALESARDGMEGRVGGGEKRGKRAGMYCCGTCSCAYWRNLLVGGLNFPEGRLAAGMKDLKARRFGNGKWRFFPFHYTLLTLAEIELPEAVAELRYAAPVCERYLQKQYGRDRYGQRRRAVAEKVLAKC